MSSNLMQMVLIAVFICVSIVRSASIPKNVIEQNRTDIHFIDSKLAACEFCGEHGTCYLEESVKKCKCNEGYADDEGTCKLCDCGSDGQCIFENGLKKCQCNYGFSDDEGICKSCYCGEYSRSCSFDRFGSKNCECYFGAIQINDYCHAIGSVSVISTTKMPSTTEFPTPKSCDCGKYSRSCSFDRFGRKNCDCYSGAIQINDYCYAIGNVSVISTTKMPRTTEFTTPKRETTTAASTTEMTSTTKFLTTPSCECGRYSRSCRFDYFGRQVCECYPGYVQINNYCHEESTTAVSTTEMRSTAEISTTPKTTPTPSVVTSEKPRTTIPTTTPRDCYCGINSRSCRLDWFGRKVCDCYPGYEQIDGYCLARTTTVRPITTTREICNDEKCLYGKCQVLGYGYECRCYEGYTGSRCENKIQSELGNLMLGWMIVVSFIVLIGMFFFLCRTKK